MRLVVCTRARSGVAVGDVAGVPDGAEVSPLYYAEAGSPEAEKARAAAAAGQEGPGAAPPAPEAGGQEPPGTPVPPQPLQPLSGVPDDAKGM